MIKSDIDMKRDMDLIRAMLLAIESDPHPYAPKIEIEGYTQEQIDYHAILLGEAGLAKVHEIRLEESHTPVATTVERLTWAGHEFLDSAREKQTWNQAKDLINKVSGASLQVWMMVLTKIIEKKLGL